MKIIEQSHKILSCPDNILEMIEQAGRTCYKSEDKITADSAAGFVKRLRDRGHHAMIEFQDIIVKFITNRGVTHEIVRHRLCNFAQELTRYVRYDGNMEFIRPVWCSSKMVGLSWGDLAVSSLSEAEYVWLDSCYRDEEKYNTLLNLDWRPEQAREVLPNSLKTEIVVKANIREWRHILKLRTHKTAHPQMRALMLPLLEELRGRVPVVFDDI